jgi:hypothetical protein
MDEEEGMHQRASTLGSALGSIYSYKNNADAKDWKINCNWKPG